MPLPVRTAPREANRIREVFLSATAQDVAAFRKGVKEALENIKTSVFLQETWAVPAAGVVTLCLGRLAQSDAYLGVFGYRYGWIPDGETRSITEIEYDGALTRWQRVAVPPIFVFIPSPGSEAAKALDEEAARILIAEHPTDEPRRLESRRLQKRFCDRLSGSGLFAGMFSSLQELRERALASIANWNVEILERAGKDAERSDIPASYLGAIDRDDQLRALENALLALGAGDAPGMCVAVHGNEDAGLFAFLSFLESWDDWDISGETHSILPAHDRFDAASVLAAARAELDAGATGVAATADDVAAAILARCQDEPVVMFLSPLDRMDGGIAAFHDLVWKPVFAAAQARASVSRPAHRFVLVVGQLSRLGPPWPESVSSSPIDQPGVDYSAILPLPELGLFTAGNIVTWLKKHGVKLPLRQPIADRVTRDGVPRAVFDRLNSDGFWSTLND